MSSVRTIKLDAFHKLFTEFLNDLNTIQPNDTGLLLIRTAISMISAETLVSQFMEYVGEYSDKILAKDESFFLIELPNNLGASSFASREIKRVEKIWKNPSTTKEIKECIWNYFICLIKLGKSITK